MSEIHKIEKNGVTIYPATTTDAVVDADDKLSVKELFNNADSKNYSATLLFEKLPISSVLVENSYYQSISGVISSGEDFKRTKKIYVPKGKKVLVSGVKITNIHSWTLRGVHSNDGQIYEFQKDYDCYIGINIPSGNDVSTAYIQFNGDAKSSIEQLFLKADNIPYYYMNIIPQIEFIDGYYFDIHEGNKESAKVESSSFRYAEINVEPGESFIYSSKVGGVSMAAITFYDQSGQLISYDGKGNSSSPTYTDRTVTVPPAAKTMIFSTYVTFDGIKLGRSEKVLNKSIDAIEKKLEENCMTISEVQGKIGILDSAFNITSKNLYNGEFIAGYVNSNGSFNDVQESQPYRSTGLIPVKPDTYYCISGRKETSSSNIRCLDKDGANPTKVRIASTGLEYSSWYTPSEDGLRVNPNSQIKTSPTASYIQFNIQWSTEHEDFNEVMVELVGDSYVPGFTPSPYQPYMREAKLKASALPENVSNDNIALVHKKVSLKNTPVIMVTGASHSEGFGSVKDKAFISYLSAMLDWNVENYSLSGSDNIEHFNRIVQIQQISNVHPKNLSGGYSLILLGGNETAYYSNGIDAKYFRDNIIRLCSAVKSYGFEPVLCSYCGDMSRPWSVVVQNVADEYGYMFIDLNANGYRFYNPIYRPWWYNAHYATRSNAIQWFNFLKVLDYFEKPYSAVKIFRNRNAEPSDINDLLFDDRYEKMKLWRELTLHHQALKNGYEKYVDRLDLTVYTDNEGDTVNIGALENVPSEYNSFRLGSPITIQDKALIQFTLPSVAPDIENLKFKLDTEGDVEVYVRQYVSSDLVVGLSDRGGSFHLTTDSPAIYVGDVYSDSNNAGIYFTVVEYNAEDQSLIATPSGDFTSEGNMAGTLTRTSGTGTQILNYDKLLDVPGESYFEKALSPKGKWVLLTNSKDSYPITDPSSCMDYDRLDFLVKTPSGSGFIIKNTSMEFDTYREKNRRKGKDQRCLALAPETGNQLLAKTTFENAVADWGAPANATAWNGQVQYTDGNGVKQTGNHIPTFFKTQKNVTGILRLNKGQSVWQAVDFVGEEYYCHKYKLKIVARYYPEEALDIDNLPSDVRTSRTFDFAKIGISFKVYNDSIFTKEVYVPLSFVEIEQDIILDAPVGRDGNILTITALDDRVELLLCELYA